MPKLSALSDDDLADGICTWAGRMAAGEAELLQWIAEFDRREAWGGWGLLSCAHWLSWRIGLSPGAAREKVRIARLLEELPLVQAAFAAGRLSYSQVRAITRAATPQDQERWVELARSATAGQLEKLVRGVRRARTVEQGEADPELASWKLRARKTHDADGNAVYTIVLPEEQSAVVDAAIELWRAELDAQRSRRDDVSAETSSPEAVPAPRPVDGDLDQGPASSRATVADALVAMAAAAIERHPVERPAAMRRLRSALVAQVDPLSGWGRLRNGELLPPSSLKAVLRSLPGREGPVRLRPLTADDLRTKDLGRTQRTPSLALRELLGTIDGERCRFPGCTRHRRLHAHHVVFWSDGGRTDLANLVLLCSRHHTLVHTQGFTLTLAEDRTLTVTTADGVPVRHLPTLPWRPAAELDPQQRVSAETLPPDAVDRWMDLEYAVSVLVQQAA